MRLRRVHVIGWEWKPAAGLRARSSRGMLLGMLALCALVVVTGCASATGGHGGPTATPTTQQRVAALAGRAIGNLAQHVETTYDAGSQTIKVTATVGAFPNVSTAQERVKVICFRTQEALWTSGISLREATVTVLGPLLDDYGDSITDAYGVADLMTATAARFEWGTLSADGAWNTYDRVWLRQSYDPYHSFDV